MLTVEKIETLLRPVLEGGDLELLDLKVLGAKGRTAFYAVIDHRFRPVSIQELTTMSRQIEDILDMSEEVPREYSLDVTSPGIDHPLRYEWEYSKNVGRKLKMEIQRDPADLADGKEPRGDKQTETFSAELTEVRDGVLQFADGRTVPLDRVRLAKVKLPW